MEMIGSLVAAVLAGLLSVASPCVLPVLPIIITGHQDDDHARPLFIVVGLAFTFIAMGILTAIFGGLITAHMNIIEKIAGTVILLFGLLMIFNINPFKFLSFLSNIHVKAHGRWEGLILGLTLGIIWIPCVGMFLSAILFDVAIKGKIVEGIIMMIFYSIGFAIPMLGVAYASHFTRKQISFLARHPRAVSIVSGLILSLFGLYIIFWGLVGFGF